MHHQCRSWPPGPQPPPGRTHRWTPAARACVGPVDPVVRPPDRQLPAHVGLGLQRLPALPQREDVQRAARAAREPGPVLEDAGPLEGPRLPGPLLVLGDPAVARASAWCCQISGVSRATCPATRFSSSSSEKWAPSEQHPSSARPAWMPWQPLPKMQFQREVSHVRSQRKTCSSSAGSGNSTGAGEVEPLLVAHLRPLGGFGALANLVRLFGFPGVRLLRLWHPSRVSGRSPIRGPGRDVLAVAFRT